MKTRREYFVYGRRRQEKVALVRRHGGFAEEKSLGCPPAVDDEVGAGNVARVLGREINRQLADFLRFAPATERDFGNELLVQFLVLKDRCVQFSGERAGADAVDGDFFRGEFEGQSAGEAEQSGLAGAVGRASSEGDMAHDRRQINDPTVAIVFQWR